MCNYFILSITRTSDCSVLWRCEELYCYPQTAGNEHKRVTMHLSINIVVKCGKCFCDLLWGNSLDNVQLVVQQLCALSSWWSRLLVLKSSLVHPVGGPWTGHLSSTTCKGTIFPPMGPWHVFNCPENQVCVLQQSVQALIFKTKYSSFTIWIQTCLVSIDVPMDTDRWR